jgi:hypothetical protein
MTLTSINIAETINKARALDKQRLQLAKEVQALESQVSEYKKAILEHMRETQQAQFTTTSTAWAKVTDKEVMNVTNWTKLYAFIVGCYDAEDDHEQDVAFAMLQRRPTDSVVKTFMEIHGLTAEQVGVEFTEINVVKLGGA